MITLRDRYLLFAFPIESIQVYNSERNSINPVSLSVSVDFYTGYYKDLPIYTSEELKNSFEENMLEMIKTDNQISKQYFPDESYDKEFIQSTMINLNLIVAVPYDIIQPLLESWSGSDEESIMETVSNFIINACPGRILYWRDESMRKEFSKTLKKVLKERKGKEPEWDVP